MTAAVIRRPTVPADPSNEAIGDHLVGTSNGVQLRRITHTDPRDGEH